MAATSRIAVLLLSATLVVVPLTGEAKRHGHGHHGRGGWMHSPFAVVRGWFRHVAQDAPRPSHRESAARRSRQRAQAHAADQAVLAARRRSEVDAYLRDHPAYASAQ